MFIIKCTLNSNNRVYQFCVLIYVPTRFTINVNYILQCNNMTYTQIILSLLTHILLLLALNYIRSDWVVVLKFELLVKIYPPFTAIIL